MQNPSTNGASPRMDRIGITEVEGDYEILCPLMATVDGVPAFVTAVLERTVVYYLCIDKNQTKKVANKRRVRVYPNRVRFTSRSRRLDFNSEV
jgi:hypothetical protein